jgi:hypothetical protein
MYSSDSEPDFFCRKSSENPRKSEKPKFEKIEYYIATDVFRRAESKNATFFSPTKNGRVTPGKASEKWKTGKFKRRQK